ncbi:integral membrane protein 2B-like [Sinocyclocheilus grahami]|uniref:integral membrane protein 2B-like n=1 Tax=Sinocyclocheilus grahami TaxID=75366 RepID=UPI0007ACAD8C|nr:PREDICTED: integral membrane protein 2B-like [Sinocyclocheilus grahami]
MVKVSFNKALAFKDPKKESLILDVQDSEAAVLVRPQSKVWCWCFCLGLALVLSGVVVGGAFLYRYYMLEVQGVMDGRADERKDAHTSLEMVSIKVIPFHRFVDREHWRHLGREDALETITRAKPSVQTGKLGLSIHQISTWKEFEAPLMLLEENVSFFEDDEVELIKVPVPEFRDGDSAGILHDFTMKLTAYLDMNLDRCYIITLNTSIVMPPRDFQEFLVNIKAGMYLPQTYLMREEMMVTERLDSTSDLGYYINDLCKDKDTYRLQRRDIILGMQKREALNCHKIRHFENKFVVETLICEQ